MGVVIARVRVCVPMGEVPEEQPGTVGANAASTVISLLFAGILVWGGIGWLLDWWLGTSFFLPTGILVGSAAAIYLVIRRASRMTSDQELN